MKLIFVRHGETDVNYAKKYLGHYDAPLNDKGKTQAELIAEKLAGYKITRFFSSDLARAKETAAIIGQRIGQKAQVTSALRELHFGDWELHTYDELIKKDEDRLRNWYDDPWKHSPPNGESMLKFFERFERWFNVLLEEMTDEDTLLIVTHGGIIRLFQSHWIEKDFAKYWTVTNVSHGEALICNYSKKCWNSSKLE